MWTLDGQAIFGTADCRVTQTPDTLRHAAQPAASGGGETLVAQGRNAIDVEQTGRLVADDPDALRAMLDAIRGRLDGAPRTLASDAGRRFERLVMLAVDAPEPTRLGPRWQARFTIRYRQVTA